MLFSSHFSGQETAVGAHGALDEHFAMVSLFFHVSPVNIKLEDSRFFNEDSSTHIVGH